MSRFPNFLGKYRDLATLSTHFSQISGHFLWMGVGSVTHSSPTHGSCLVSQAFHSTASGSKDDRSLERGDHSEECRKNRNRKSEHFSWFFALCVCLKLFIEVLFCESEKCTKIPSTILLAFPSIYYS